MVRSAVRPLFFATTILLVGIGLSAANAVTLPAAGWDTAVSSIQFGDVVVSATNPPAPSQSVTGAGGYASLQFSPTPTPSVTATADGYDVTAFNGSAFAQGAFRYFGQVVAPGGLVIPTTVNVTTNYSLFSQPGVTSFGSDARVKLEVFGTNVVPLTFSDQGGNNGSFTTTMTVAVNTNQTFNIEMLTRAWTFEPGVMAMAFMDPYFQLDPIQIGLGYTLEFSPGMGNSPAASAVPVPAALPLFASGLGVLAWAARRKRKTAAAA